MSGEQAFPLESLLAVQQAPALDPLGRSHEADAVETELKALFMRLVEENIRPAERSVNVAALPHLGEFDLVEFAVKADGLAMMRASDQGQMRQLYKAWRAANGKRGLKMLRTYLQLVWPNQWVIKQLWCPSLSGYPGNCTEAKVNPTDILTSRLRVYLSASIAMEDIGKVGASLRSAIPARMILGMHVASGDTYTAPLNMAVGAIPAVGHRLTATAT